MTPLEQQVQHTLWAEQVSGIGGIDSLDLEREEECAAEREDKGKCIIVHNISH